MADEEIDVLTIDTLVKNVNIVSFALLYLCNRFHQSLVLFNTFSISILTVFVLCYYFGDFVSYVCLFISTL